MMWLSERERIARTIFFFTGFPLDTLQMICLNIFEALLYVSQHAVPKHAMLYISNQNIEVYVVMMWKGDKA